MENDIYTLSQMREMDVDTSGYSLVTEPGDYFGTVEMKAEAREAKLRLFLRFEDGGRIFTPLFWWQRGSGLWDIPVGQRLLLHYAASASGFLYLRAAELCPEKTDDTFLTSNVCVRTQTDSGCSLRPRR